MYTQYILYTMATIAMMIGGAVVNALAFSGSNFGFSLLDISKDLKGTIRHNAAIEKFHQARDHWNQKRIGRVDHINETLEKENYEVSTLKDIGQATQDYFTATGEKLSPLGPEPQLCDFYKPSEDQQRRELIFVTVGRGATGPLAYNFLH